MGTNSIKALGKYQHVALEPEKKVQHINLPMNVAHKKVSIDYDRFCCDVYLYTTQYCFFMNDSLYYVLFSSLAWILSEALIREKLMSGKLLIEWRHDLCAEITKKRYISDQEVMRATHAEIVNLFFPTDDESEEIHSETSDKSSELQKCIYLNTFHIVKHFFLSGKKNFESHLKTIFNPN